jgi:hypothetical protein
MRANVSEPTDAAWIADAIAANGVDSDGVDRGRVGVDVRRR